MAKFQLTCVVDADLIGPLTELIAPYSRVSIKLVEDGTTPPKLPIVAHAHVDPPFIASRRTRTNISFHPEKGVGTVVVLRAVARELTVQQIKRELEAAGLNANGSGATLSKLKSRGYVRHLDKGTWRLTMKGEASVKRLEGVKVGAVREVEATSETIDS